MTLLELAARCEAATGPDRELERGIKAALEGREYISYQDDLANRNGATPPRYTASLDAAMSLVPEGLAFGVTNIEGGDYDEMNFSRCTAVLHGGDVDLCRSEAATPALALTAACLRARASAVADPSHASPATDVLATGEEG